MSDKDVGQTAVVLFDGVCLLCQGAVKWIIRLDPDAYFRFASLQSDAGRELLQQYGGTADGPMNTMFLLEQGTLHSRSTAAVITSYSIHYTKLYDDRRYRVSLQRSNRDSRTFLRLHGLC